MSDQAAAQPAPKAPLEITERELLYRLGWFTRVRWIMASAGLALLLVSWYGLGVRFRVGTADTMAPALAVIAAIFLYNIVFAILFGLGAGRVARRKWIVRVALAQIACDLAAVCLLVHFTGGVENFFLLLVLLPVVIATELLPRPLAYVVALAAAAGVNALAWGEQQGLLSHVEIIWPAGPASRSFHADALHVLALTTAMTATVFATAVIAASITGRLRRRERELERTYRMLREADEAKSFFMRKAGHEMRAPLAAIYSILDALGQVCTDMTPQHVMLVDRGRRRLQALMALVDDLRRYSRLRSPQTDMARGRVNLGELVAATVDLFRQQATDGRVTISCHVPSPVWVEGDEGLLGEMATNLVANAIQYTPAGGTIDVRLASENGLAALKVRDTGIGISDDAKARIFEEFYRSPEAKEVFPQGTGLGLAIVKRIVEMHNGRIEVNSRKGEGTEFTVSLPATS
ncbi:MAG: sensor histidine kinase [Phycisphaerae bacterium]